jgi:uncharacterized protein (DUF1015 family)
MAKVYPFHAVLPDESVAAKVSSPPYDVMSTDEARGMAERNPLSFLRVIRSEIDLPADTDPYSAAVYQRALENYQRLKQNAPLVKSKAARFYIYRLIMNGHEQTGIAATPAVADYDCGVIKKHEKTRQVKENDRTRHIMTLRAQTGMVFLTYRDHAEINSIVEQITTTSPLFDFTANDGVTHTVWAVDESLNSMIISAFDEVPALYIADGHHRAASASRVQAELTNAAGETENAPWARFLAVVFPASQLSILAYNRVVKGLNGHDAKSLFAAIEKIAAIRPADSADPPRPGSVCMYLDGKWWLLEFKSIPTRLSPVESLDVSLLQDQVLAPILGIADPRTDERIDFVGGIRGADELEKRIADGSADIAFSMYPATVEQLMDISDADEIMPPKSTWFEPKLRDGLLIHEI